MENYLLLISVLFKQDLCAVLSVCMAVKLSDNN